MANGRLRDRITRCRRRSASCGNARPGEGIEGRDRRDLRHRALRLLLGTTKRPRLNAEQLRRVETELMSATLDEVLGLFPDDRLLSNFVLNLWEWGTGQDHAAEPALECVPPDLRRVQRTLHLLHVVVRRTASAYDRAARTVRARAAHYGRPSIGLVGHGEPLSHPRLGDIADRLADYLDRRAASHTITNGVFLPKWFDRLDQLRLKSSPAA